MGVDVSAVYLSAIDEQGFGFRIARAPKVTLEALPPILAFCRDHEVVMLIARCLASELPAAQAMEREGFRLMDTLVYYERDLVKTPIPSSADRVPMRSIRPGEEEAVRRVAAESFRGYVGHYHADSRLDRDKCDEAYASWAFRSCVSRDTADDVLVAELDGEIVAFVTMRCNSPEEAEWVLGGIASVAQGRGIYWSIMTYGMQWALTRGITRMVISTQITNVAVQGVWARAGFEPTHAYYTFHKWFDTPPAAGDCGARRGPPEK